MEVTFHYFSNIKCIVALIASYTLSTLIFVADVITPGRIKRIKMTDRGIVVTRYAYEVQ
jgi:hypothetical protein